MGDSDYDGDLVSQAVLEKQPDAQVIIPLHDGVLSCTGESQRDRHIQTIVQLVASHGSGSRDTISDYVELAMQRDKRISGNTIINGSYVGKSCNIK